MQAGNSDRQLNWRLLLRVFIPFGLGYFLSYLFRVVNAVLSPQISRDLGLNAEQLGLMTSLYFLTFALFQIPLGVLLDRYGPKKTEACLLLFAFCGAMIFSYAEQSASPLLGRALIGLGVSACLMAAFKAYSQWFHSSRLPFINGLQMAAGGLGAYVGTTPVNGLLAYTDWRGIFLILAVLTLATALLIYWIVPNKPTAQQDQSWAKQFNETLAIFRSSGFWKLACVTTASQAAFLSIQSLWAGPWLRDVAGLSADQAAGELAIIAGAMISGFLTMGYLASHLQKFSVSTERVALLGMCSFILCQGNLLLNGDRWLTASWMAFGFFGTSGILTYAALTQRFALSLAGRVITAINFVVFVAAFLLQWLMGVIIEQWPTAEPGRYQTLGYTYAFALAAGLQLIGIVAYWRIKIKPRGDS